MRSWGILSHESNDEIFILQRVETCVATTKRRGINNKRSGQQGDGETNSNNEREYAHLMKVELAKMPKYA